MLRGERIAPDLDVEEIVAAILVAVGLELNPGILIGERDGGAGDRLPGGIAHGPQNLGALELPV